MRMVRTPVTVGSRRGGGAAPALAVALGAVLLAGCAERPSGGRGGA